MSKTTRIILISAVLVGGAALFAWWWFNKHTSDVHVKYIPKEAAAVLSIHTMEIAQKIDPSKLESLKPATDAVNDIPDFLLNIMTDPLATGIDPMQNFYAFVEKEKQSTVSALVVAVDDESDFTAFAEKMFPERKAEDLGDMNYLDIDDSRGLAWNKEAAVFVAVNEIDVRAYTEALFAQAEDESIKADTAFTSFNAKTFDAGLLTNNERLSMLNDETSPLALIGMGAGYSQFFIRFDQNEIVAEYIAPAQSSGGSIFQAGGPPESDLAMLGTKDPLIFLSLNFDMKQLLNTSANDPVMGQNVEMMTASLGLTNDEMVQLFTGSVVVAVSDYKDIFSTDPRVQKEAQDLLGPIPGGDLMSDMMTDMLSIEVPVTTINLGITDEKVATNMMNGLGMNELAEEFWAAPGVELVIYVVIKNNHLVITNDYLTAEAIHKDGSLPGKLPADYSKQVSSQPFSVWLDFDKSHFPPLLMAPKNPILGEEDLAAYVAVSGLLSNIRYESTTTGSTFHFAMPEGEDNSIMRVLRYLQPTQ